MDGFEQIQLYFFIVIALYLTLSSIAILFVLLPAPLPVMGAAEVTGLGFVCFVVINPCVLSANRAGLGYLFHKFSIIRLVISTFTQIFIIEISFALPPSPQI